MYKKGIYSANTTINNIVGDTLQNEAVTKATPYSSIMGKINEMYHKIPRPAKLIGIAALALTLYNPLSEAGGYKNKQNKDKDKTSLINKGDYKSLAERREKERERLYEMGINPDLMFDDYRDDRVKQNGVIDKIKEWLDDRDNPGGGDDSFD